MFENKLVFYGLDIPRDQLKSLKAQFSGKVMQMIGFLSKKICYKLVKVKIQHRLNQAMHLITEYYRLHILPKKQSDYPNVRFELFEEGKDNSIRNGVILSLKNEMN